MCHQSGTARTLASQCHMATLPAPSSAPSTARARPTPVSPRIDDPMALLLACHDKVRRFTELALRLQAHVTAHGHDAQAREAATSILRYFELAAPLHHADEDEDLFPALLALDEALVGADVRANIQTLSDEHAALGTLWQALAPWLRDVAAGRADGTADAAPPVAAFAARYQAHADAEEREVYPHAAKLPPEALARIAQAMVARRTPPSASPDALQTA